MRIQAQKTECKSHKFNARKTCINHWKQVTTKHVCFEILKDQKWFEITSVEMISHTLNI
jgi:hypothetical protein